ncbi:IS21 family transposase [Rhodoferax antarcticus]|uniref:Integrase core domain protein n=1 Tax=Rhodoferax antarcticus ANT.BR TaxID=1111071 RepID=A0A1Q8YCC6_9BURK|nr:IS21 family transposase [Rhodoferax antarcticus]OLP04621.1 integrase, catalytic region [Rhodoferax antarcticus ANT.BR]OLP05696.1 integrase core domain protein [Rhodoferax antarcticus ANT.BR]
MRKIRQVLRLVHETDLSQRAIARSLGLSREAVSNHITRATAAGLVWPLPPDTDDAALEARLFPPQTGRFQRKVEPNWVDIQQELKAKGATLIQLHVEYLADHPDGLQRSQFCERYRQWCKTLKSYMRFTHVAGERVFVDYAGPTMPVIDMATGEIRRAQIFVGVMGASNYTYAEAHWSQKLPNWIAAHTNMFEFFGAVPKVIVCDNLKSAVIHASRTEPVINATYQSLADHYSLTIIPARPRTPKDKGKVENGVLVVERWILFRLRKRVFHQLHDLNQAIQELLLDLNQRKFQKLPGSRRSTFEALDLPAMQPLPNGDFEYAEFRRVRVSMDGCVSVDDRPYSVPQTLVRKEVVLPALAAPTTTVFCGLLIIDAPGLRSACRHSWRHRCQRSCPSGSWWLRSEPRN